MTDIEVNVLISPPGPMQKRWPFGDTPFLKGLREHALSPSDPAIHLAYRCLLKQFEEMIAQEPIAWEGLGPEGVHQMRVATRRIRAVFRAFRDVLPTRAIDSFNRDFKWVATGLGGVRDLDVYQDNLRKYAAELPADDVAQLCDCQEHLAQQWRHARKRLLLCLEGRRYDRLKDRFARFLKRGPSRAVMKKFSALTIGDAAQQLIGKRDKRLRRDGRAITPASAPQSLHALRIQCKRLRYLVEFFRPIYGKGLKPSIKQLRKVQKVLGDFHDACMATDQLRRYAQCVPLRARNRGQLIVLGQLIGGQRRQAAIRRADFRQAWKRFDGKGRRKEILAALGRKQTTPNRASVHGSESDQPSQPDLSSKLCVAQTQAARA